MATRRSNRKPKTVANSRRSTTARSTRRNATKVYVGASPKRANYRRTAINPKRRKARNPSVKNLVVGSFFAAIGAMAQKTISGFIPLKAEGVMGLAVELGVAWLTASLGERFLSGPNAYAFGLGAAGGFGASAVNYLLGFAQSGVGMLTSAGQPKQLPAAQGGTGDIVAWGGMHDIISIPR